MVLIEVRNSDGIIGRCDAKCYEAITGKCTCICGGVNHGRGLNSAIKATRNLYVEQILANTPGAKLDDQVVRPKVKQALFNFALPGVKVNKRTESVTHKTRRAKKKPVRSPRVDETQKPDPESVTSE